MMLSEKEVRNLYQTAKDTVAKGMIEVTIDVHVVEAEQQCRAFAAVLGEEYVPPKRGRG